MKLDDIVAYVLTLNEQDNIAKCMDALRWAREVIVVDSFSNDATLEIARKYPNVRVVQRVFDNHSNQHNFALDQIPESKWVLRLDADWLVTESLLSNLRSTYLAPAVFGLRIPFTYSIYGEFAPISLYPPVIALFKRAGARYVQDGHTERLVPDGPVIDCSAKLIHEDRKPIDRFLHGQMVYSKLELEKFTQIEPHRRGWKARVRSWPCLAPLLMAFYLLCLKGGAFRGRASLHYVLQKMVAESILSLRILDEKIRKGVD